MAQYCLLPPQPSLKEQLRQIIKDKPKINTVNELIDWKIHVWEQQYLIDDRIQCLWNSLSEDEKDNVYDTVILNYYIPVVPFFQQILLLINRTDVLYGGARGGGKSEGSLMAAVQYGEFSQWKVGVFRLTYPDLSAPGAIMDRAKDWWHKDRNPIYKNSGLESPHWDGTEKTFTFPSGAKIKFAGIEHDKDADKYQGAEFHLVIIDEAVLFTEHKITSLSGAVRKQIIDPLPIRCIYTGNPGGVSHDYFNEFYIIGIGFFIDSKYTDNLYLNDKEYEEKSLNKIKDSDPIKYRQWKYGDWQAIPQGKLFKRKWFTDRLFTHIKEKITKWLRFWDLAATKEEDPTKTGGPDWTAGGLFALGESGKAYLMDVIHVREDEDIVEELIINTAHEDGRHVIIRIEQEGGASGKHVIGRFSRDLPGFDCDGQPVQRKAKIDRARAWVSFIKHGGLKIKDGGVTQDGVRWITSFLNEITAYPTKGVHDDQVDVISGGLTALFGLDGMTGFEPDWEMFEEFNDYD